MKCIVYLIVIFRADQTQHYIREDPTKFRVFIRGLFGVY